MDYGFSFGAALERSQHNGEEQGAFAMRSAPVGKGQEGTRRELVRQGPPGLHTVDGSTVVGFVADGSSRPALVGCHMR